MQYKAILFTIFVCFAVSCGGPLNEQSSGKGGTTGASGGSTVDTTGSGINGATQVSGQAITQSGTGVAGATVYIPGTEIGSECTTATRAFTQGLEASDGTTCEDAPVADQPMAAVCTAADGSFIIDTSKLVGNPTQIIIRKGSLCIIVPLSCSDTNCVIDTTSTTVGSSGNLTIWPKVAVVSGFYDRMEDVLAKLGDDDLTDATSGAYGRIDPSTGIFVYGSEIGTNLTIIDGTSQTVNDVTGDAYTTWDRYMNGTLPLVTGGKPLFDMIFINCGDSYESLLDSHKAILQDYVNAGGRLFITDQAYDFMEQPFPYIMMFENDPADANTPGTRDAAQTGSGGTQYNVKANSDSMMRWLATASVNRHDASTPGNPEADCASGATYKQYSSALLSNNLLPLGGLVEHWVHMISAQTGFGPLIWISSGDTAMDGLLDRPLTASMDVGSNGGRIVYSSYHTAHDCPSTGFWPQERVLQYLILDSF